MERKPWIEGSLEVLELAIEQYYMGVGSNKERDLYRYLRVSLINTDDAAELAIKAFIQYHTSEKAQRNFHRNLNWILKKGPFYDVVISKGLVGKIRYYHNLRDTLYHQGYSLTIPRLEVLGYIVKIIELFRLLFKVDLDGSLGYNHRQRFLIRSIDLEKSLLDLCSMNKVVIGSTVELSALIWQMLEGKLISEDMRSILEQVISLQQQIVPGSQPVNEVEGILETIMVLEETITEIKKISEGAADTKCSD